MIKKEYKIVLWTTNFGYDDLSFNVDKQVFDSVFTLLKLLNKTEFVNIIGEIK